MLVRKDPLQFEHLSNMSIFALQISYPVQCEHLSNMWIFALEISYPV